MNQDQWLRVRGVFERAVDLPAAARAELLARELGDDVTLCAAVERLLAAEPNARQFLTPPGCVTLGATLPTGLLGPRPGDRLGPYRLVRLIGTGGMGAVFEASQDLPKRSVAVKVMRTGLESDRARRRFHDEIELLAKLQHAGIAQVFSAGIAGDQPWFAMELLADAQPITAHAEAHGLSLSARLALLLTVAAAIEHAHQRGVIHRDLKPANILVDRQGRTKVIDFGIACSAGTDLERISRGDTSAGQLLGTLLYMSPERLQAADDVADVRSDVYGLGVVLYELLTGRRPFDVAGMSLAAACRVITEQEPAPPGSITNGPPELDWIVQRALSKDRDRRYPSVAEFAADLQRFGRHEPVLAAPPSLGYRARKLLRRHRTMAAAAAIVLLITAAAFVGITNSLWRARRAEAAERQGRTAADASAHRAEVARTFLLDVFAMASPDNNDKGVHLTMGQALDRAASLFEQRFRDDPRARAELARTIGLAYEGLGDQTAAEHHLRTALSICSEHFPTDPVGLAASHLDLAGVLLDAQRLPEASGELDAADALLAGHSDDKTCLIARVHRGHLLLAQDDKAGAATLLRDTVAELRRRLGDDDHDTLIAMNLLGSVLHELGDLDGAEQMYRAALQGMQRNKGADDPSTLTALHNLSMLSFSRRPSHEAIAMLEQVLTARRRMLGDDHEETLSSMANLGAQHYMLGEFDDAARLWEEALGHLDQANPDAPVRQALMTNLATIERQRENWPRATELSREILAVRQRTLGPAHEKTLMTQNLLAEVYRQAGDLDDAAEQYSAALELAQHNDPPDLPNVYRCHLGLGRIAFAQRRFEDAEAALLACRDGYDAAVAACAVKSMLLRVESELVSLYTAWGKDELVARYRAIIDDPDYRERAGTDK